MEKGKVKKEKLSYEDNSQLLPLAKAGDAEAMNRLIEANLPLVTSISKKFINRGYDYEDIYQIGCMGLVKAINNFDDNYNVKFSTYAVPMIIGEIRRYLRDNNSIRVSRSIRDMAYKVLQIKERVTRQTGREPTIEEIAKELGVEKEEVAFSLDAIQDPVSLQEPIYKDGTENLYIMDQVKDTKNIDEKWVENLTIAQALKKLNPREKEIIARRFFDGRTQMEVAEEIGISQAQVSRLEKCAINRIRKAYK